MDGTFHLAQVQLDIGEILRAISPTHSWPYAPPRHCATYKMQEWLHHPLWVNLSTTMKHNVHIIVTLFKVSNVFLRGLLSLIGTSDINSTPPAIAVSHWPLAIRPTAATENSTFFNEKCIPKCKMEVDRQRKYSLDFEKILILQIILFWQGFH